MPGGVTGALGHGTATGVVVSLQSAVAGDYNIFVLLVEGTPGAVRTPSNWDKWYEYQDANFYVTVLGCDGAGSNGTLTWDNSSEYWYAKDYVTGAQQGSTVVSVGPSPLFSPNLPISGGDNYSIPGIYLGFEGPSGTGFVFAYGRGSTTSFGLEQSGTFYGDGQIQFATGAKAIFWSYEQSPRQEVGHTTVLRPCGVHNSSGTSSDITLGTGMIIYVRKDPDPVLSRPDPRGALFFGELF